MKKKEELKTFDINMFLLETERLRELTRGIEEKLQLATDELSEAGIRYEEMKAEYEAIEEEVEGIDLSIEKAKSQLNETTLLKQQLEGQINVLKEQINTVRMNDEHYGKRQQMIRIRAGDKGETKRYVVTGKSGCDRETDADIKTGSGSEAGVDRSAEPDRRT